MNASPARLGLDALLAHFPGFDLVSIDWQIEWAWGIDPNERTRTSVQQHTGPWVLVTLGQRSEAFDQTPAWAIWEFAIFKRTGAVHSMSAGGAVSDEPILQPQEAP